MNGTDSAETGQLSEAIGRILPALEASVSALGACDPATDTWTGQADIPTPRWGLSASAVKAKIYVIGGSPQGWPFEGLSTVEEFDTRLASVSVGNGD